MSPDAAWANYMLSVFCLFLCTTSVTRDSLRYINILTYLLTYLAEAGSAVCIVPVLAHFSLSMK